MLCPVAREPADLPPHDFSLVTGLSILATNGTAANCWSWKVGNSAAWKGSYTINGYFFTSKWLSPPEQVRHFRSFASVDSPTTTPVFLDGMMPRAWIHSGAHPFLNLFEGGDFYGLIGRHGSRYPRDVPRRFVFGEPLPAKWFVNVGFADGHGSKVRLSEIEQLTWEKAVASSEKPR
jgi:prepilin-type processing-associated H-X9-DG protein